MLLNRGLASKEVGIKGAGLQDLKAQKQTVVGGAGGGRGKATQMNHTDVKLTQHCPAK